MAVIPNMYSLHTSTKIYWCRTACEVSWLVRLLPRGTAYTVRYESEDITATENWANLD